MTSPGNAADQLVPSGRRQHPLIAPLSGQFFMAADMAAFLDVRSFPFSRPSGIGPPRSAAVIATITLRTQPPARLAARS